VEENVENERDHEGEWFGKGQCTFDYGLLPERTPEGTYLASTQSKRRPCQLGGRTNRGERSLREMNRSRKRLAELAEDHCMRGRFLGDDSKRGTPEGLITEPVGRHAKLAANLSAFKRKKKVGT